MTVLRILKQARILIEEFATLIVFWLAVWLYDLRIAIAAVIAFVVLDVLRRQAFRVPFTIVYVLSSGLAGAFGMIDLFAATPFMLKYEGVVTNCVIGFMFAAGALAERPLFQNIAEDWVQERFPPRADVRRFFALFTSFWAAYFFTKAGVYLWLGEHLPLERALAVRTIFSIASLIVMVALSTQARHMFNLLSFLHLLPREPNPVPDIVPEAGT